MTDVRPLVVALGSVVVVACNERPSTGPDAGIPVSSAALVAPTTVKRPLRASGPVGALFAAVERLSLRDAQRKQLDDVAAERHDAEVAAAAFSPDAAASDKALHAMLVTGVRAGKVDPAAIDSAIEKLSRSEDATRERDARALNAVHALLDAQQRATAVTSARSADRRGAHVKKGPPPLADAAPRLDMARLKFESWARDLDLDAEQKKRFAEILPQERPVADEYDEDATRDALFDAFEKDAFDARRFAARDATKRRLAPFLGTVAFLDRFVPLLRPEQRERLASTLEKSSTER